MRSGFKQVGAGPRGLPGQVPGSPTERYLRREGLYATALGRRRAEQRKTKRTPSELKRRRKAKPRRVPAERYDRRSYRQAVVRACDKANDAALGELAEELAKTGKTPEEIEKELEYPGQIKVTVLRETRAVDYAR